MRFFNYADLDLSIKKILLIFLTAVGECGQKTKKSTLIEFNQIPSWVSGSKSIYQNEDLLKDYLVQRCFENGAEDPSICRAMAKENPARAQARILSILLANII